MRLFQSEALATATRDISADPTLLSQAQRMVAEGYHELATASREITAEQVFQMICDDEYHLRNRAHTLATFGDDPEGVTRISGLARVVFGALHEAGPLPPIDAMNFVVPLDGWSHDKGDASSEQVAEIGRFVIAPEYRTPAMRSAKVPQRITWSLYERALEVIRPLGIRYLYAIMPGYASRLLIQAGIRLEELPCRLRTEDEAANRTFEDFSIYWRRSSPKLYRFLDT